MNISTMYFPKNTRDSSSGVPFNPFRNSSNARLLKGLFLEMGGRESGMYTLRDKDFEAPAEHGSSETKLFKSLRELYLDCEDLTEYTFATQHLESWEHWTKLLDCDWFQPYIQRWRTELELKLKSRALKNIMAEAAGQTKSSFNANKWIAEKGWMDKQVEPSRRGRPSKAEINKIAMEEALSTRQIGDDLKRLGLN